MRGMPAGIGGISFRSNCARLRQSFTSSRSPCRTWIFTFVWPSTNVVNILAGACRNRGVARNDLRHHAAHRFDAERQRRDVEQQHVALAAGKNVGLNGSAERDDFVRIQFGVRNASEQRPERAREPAECEWIRPP